MQPKLFDMEQYANIAHRVRWVHGNLYVFITQYAIHKINIFYQDLMESISLLHILILSG